MVQKDDPVGGATPGIFTCIHIDGPEALTPEPQGDVTREGMAAAVGDKIVSDGIPAALFADHHPREDSEACV